MRGTDGIWRKECWDWWIRKIENVANGKHLSGCRFGQYNVGSGNCRAAAGRETDCSFRSRLSLPLAGVDPENAGRRTQTFHVKERMFSGQLCLRGLFRAFKKRDVLQPFLAGDRNKAVYTDFERLFDLVSWEAHQAVSSRLEPNRIQTKIRTDLTAPCPGLCPQGHSIRFFCK